MLGESFYQNMIELIGRKFGIDNITNTFGMSESIPCKLSKVFVKFSFKWISMLKTRVFSPKNIS
jgi:hypothetical protein